MVGYFLPTRADEREDRYYPGELETRYSGDDGSPYSVFHELTEGPDKPFQKHAFAYDIRHNQFLDLTEITPYLMGDSPEAAMGQWKLQVATGIDDQGRIIGYGTHRGRPAGFMVDGICEFLRGRLAQRDWHINLQEPVILAPHL